MSCGSAEDGATAPPPRPQLSRRPVCYKCKKSNAQYAIRQSGVCGACLDRNVRHKLATGLRQCGVRSHGPPVAVAVSGGASSLGLLEGVHSVIVGTGRGRFIVEASVVHVDETCLSPLLHFQRPDSGTPEAEEAALRASSRLPYKTLAVPLECVLLIEGGGALDLAPRPGMENVLSPRPGSVDLHALRGRLAELFRAVGPLADARHELLLSLRLRLLRALARQAGAATLLLGTPADRCASTLLAAVTCGGGASLSSQVALVDDRFSDPRIARPARDVLAKELALYARRRGAEPSASATFLTGLPPRRSVHVTSAALVDSLQASFPSTVPTVMKVAQRLRPLSAAELTAGACEGAPPPPPCPLCGGPWDGAVSPPGHPHYREMRIRGAAARPAAAPRRSRALDALRSAACHGCRSSLDTSAAAIRDGSAVDAGHLPAALGEEARRVRHWTREAMRDAVSEFLVDDEGDTPAT